MDESGAVITASARKTQREEHDITHISLGEVQVTRVEEFYGPVGPAPRTFFPNSSDEDWAQHEAWLAPDFRNPLNSNEPVLGDGADFSVTQSAPFASPSISQ